MLKSLGNLREIMQEHLKEEFTQQKLTWISISLSSEVAA